MNNRYSVEIVDIPRLEPNLRQDVTRKLLFFISKNNSKINLQRSSEKQKGDSRDRSIFLRNNQYSKT